jgi:hypothetical protein
MSENLLFNVDQCAQQQHKRDWGEQTDSDLNNDSAFPPVWKVGDRIAIQPGNLSARRKYLANATGEIKAIKGSKAFVLLDEPANKAYKRRIVNIDLCSLRLTFAQELEQVSPSLEQNSDLNSSQPQRLTPIAQISFQSDTQECITTAVLSPSPTLMDADFSQKQLTLSQLPHPVPHSLQRASDLEPQTSEIASQPSLKSSEIINPSLQPLKMSPVYSTVPIPQDMSGATSGMFFSTFPTAGTMRNGLLSAVDTLPAPSLDSEYCWLRSPGALSSTGKGRPPGQTKQEAELKQLGLLNKGEVLNPAILCQWYEIPETWLDPSESRAATELLEVNAQQQEIFSILESPPLPLTESSTLTSCPACQQELLNLDDGCGVCGWEPSKPIECTQQLKVGERTETFEQGNGVPELTPENSSEDKFEQQLTPPLSTNIECTQQLQKGDRIRITKTRTQNLSQWVGHEATVTGINGETISVAAGEGKQKKHLTLKPEWYEVIPENFLEESWEAAASAQQPKASKQKGCLYKYLENKKLKDGTIATYPRVIGDKRDPGNPQHWRWGFNWEEKVDGEWKGRSIGSVPVGAIPMIQSMQRENASLEEIIGFIKRAKAKK